jgi:hypothetical protein
MSNYPQMTIYALYDENEKILETTASCVEKALDYFKEIGYDLYENQDLHVKTVVREEQVCSWDSWHPNY